jgi:hypothetical protein
MPDLWHKTGESAKTGFVDTRHLLILFKLLKARNLEENPVHQDLCRIARVASCSSSDIVNLDSVRALLETYRIPERIRQTVTAINEEIGYEALYLLDFLPPQRSVVRLSFFKKKTEYIMKIVLRTNGPAVVFQSVTGAHGSWRHYIYKVSHAMGSRVAFKQTFMPAKITDEIIRSWFRFLLSGFNKKFKPEMLGSIEMPNERGM